MAVDPTRVKSLFLAASEIADRVERSAYLDKECRGDADLRSQVAVLLRANDESPLPPLDPAGDVTETHPQFLDNPATVTYDGQRESMDGLPGQSLGTVIAGRYTLVELIGEGGMGLVYRAQQSEPVKRQVALKLIKSGMDSKTVLARFDAERQALALMDHPNIARIYDGGVTAAGQPFFVMELVHGVPLTEYCDRERLPVAASRLNLFVSVCQAVQHAHQKGIIHRDLKPANVLVTEVDGQPTPKVIDFGVAKATELKLTDQSFADTGAIVGTPAYMSPEQADPSATDIDTRTDVYALGVILYELLTGSPPIESKQFRRGAILEMLRMVREVEPPRPSTKLSTADALPNIAANRAIDPAKLAKLLRGELDWVVMKAIEKDRGRRYETANGLARDIQRYLADEVVEARPPSRGYRLKKFVRRHKGQVIAASLVLFTLLGGIVGTSLALMEANRATDRERKARLEEERQRVFAEAISDFVEDDFLALTSVEGQERFGGESKETLNKDMTLRDLLDRAAKKLKDRKDLEPRIEAELCWIIGVSYRGAGEHEKAAEFLKRAMQLGTDVLGRDHFFTMNAMNSLAVAYMSAGKHELALPILEETVRLETAKYGADDPNTLLTTQNLASNYRKCGQIDRSLSLHEETLRRLQARLGPDHPLTLLCMCNFGLSLSSAGQHDRALAMLDEALTRTKAKGAPDSLDVAACLHNYSEAYSATGQRARALPMIEEAVKIRTTKLGREDYRTMDSLGELATVLLELGKWQPAIALCEEVHQYTIAKLGAENPESFKTTNNLAVAYRNTGQSDRGLRLHEELLARMKARFGADHPETLLVMVNVGRGYLDSGKLEQAVAVFEETLRLAGKLGPDHSTVALAKADLGHAYRDQGKLSKALPLMEEGLRVQRIKPGPDHPVTLGTMNALAATYWQMKKLDKSIPLFEEALKGRRAKLGGDQFETLRTAGNLGINYLDTGRHAEAIPLLEEAHRAAARDERLKFVTPRLLQAYQIAKKLDLTIPILEVHVPQLKAQFGPDHLETLTNMNNLAAAYWSTKRLDKSIPLFEETLKLTVAKFGRESSETLQIVRNLGVNYRDAGRVAEAIPLLEEVHRAAAKNPKLPRMGFDLIVAYAIAGEQSKLARMVEEVSAEIRKTQPQNLANLASRFSEIGLGLLERKLWIAAEPVLREGLAIREEVVPDAWNTFNVKSMLGGALLGQKKYAEAEPLLLAGYEGLKQREKTIPPMAANRIPEALDRLMELATATNKPEQAQKWQAERVKYKEVAPPPRKRP